jgi:hypothetical protein
MAERYSWQSAYERVQPGTSPARLHAAVIEAEEAMVARTMELSTHGGGSESMSELEALRPAGNELLKIKTEKLGWPGFDPSSKSPAEE